MRHFTKEIKEFSRSLKGLTLFLAFFILLINYTNASEIDSLKAKIVGKNFIQLRIKDDNKLKSAAISGIELKLVYTGYTNSKPNYFIYNFVGQIGFILISADNDVQPILGYSFESNFVLNDKKPEAFDSLLLQYKQQIHSSRLKSAKVSNSIKEKWALLTSPNFNTLTTQAYTASSSVLPLLQTKWNQGCGYNTFCPADAAGSCGLTWTGCVAVSQTQVMKYWNYPTSGEGNHTYNHYKYGNQSADFSTAVYNWAGMPNTSGNTEIAKLMYHAGVSVNMNYGTTGSGAYFQATQTSLVNYFKYSSNLIYTYKSSYTDANWAGLLKRELDESRPLMYAGGTHAFVLDGYDTGDYFHVNWGWGGSYDGYFYLNNLKPGGYDFTSSQCAVVGVMPRNLDAGIDMADIIPLSCGIAKFDSTTNGKNRVNKYKSYYLQTTGKEKIYSITTSIKGRLKAKITGLNGKKLNLFILSYPAKDSLLAYGDSVAFLDNAKPGTYYIAVDGVYGDEGKYTINIVCPTNQPDLTITKTSINPQNIEPNQTDVSLYCRVKNIGNSAAITNKILFYYSEDKILSASDIKIDSLIVSALNPGDSAEISKTVTMCAITEGTRYVLFVVDAQNEVAETDETDNTANAYFQGLPLGIMNCSTAIPVQSGVWHKGNTSLGTANISNYLYMRNYTGKEVIHTAYAKYNGVASIAFSEKISGTLSCMVLSACNENKLERLVGVEAKNDTIAITDFPMVKNTTYYFVIDGTLGDAGEYWLKVSLPDSCPAPKISIYGDSTACQGQGSNGLYINATMGFKDYQWFNNGFPVINAITSYLSATESGKYYVEVSENECTAKSNKINITINSTPKPIILLAGTDSLKATTIADTYEWYYNSVKNAFVTQTVKPLLVGEYSVIAIKNTCRSLMSDAYNYTITTLAKLEQLEFSISPNPSSGMFTIKTAAELRNCSIKILSPTGQLIYSNKTSIVNELKIDLTGNKDGIYLIQITNPNWSKTVKLLLNGN